MKSYKFSIIIANYNGEKYLRDCLSSVFKTRYLNYEVVIVEDGSTDSSLEIIKVFQKKHPLVLVENQKNLGLVASRNKAIKRASGDILVFLDNDTQVDKNWLTELNDTFVKNKSVGAAQCKIFDYKKRNIIQEVGMNIIRQTGWGMVLGRGEKNHGQFDEPIEIVALGAAVAVRKSVAKQVGGFDEKLFHYTDDMDFSWRVWIAGHKIVLSPNAFVYHHTKIHNLSWKLYYHLSKNSLRMIIKNYEFVNVLKYLPCSLIINIFGGFFVFIKRFSLAGLFGVVWAVVWNLANLGDTLTHREKIQNLRRVDDAVIFEKIMVKDNILGIYKKLDYSQ